MNEDRISPEQNYINKRSPPVLHEEPNAQEISPHRYPTFMNHAGSQAAQAQCMSLIVNTCSFILRNLKWP